MTTSLIRLSRSARLLFLPLLVLISLQIVSTEALAASSTCQSIASEWNGVTNTKTEFYSVASLDATDQLSFTITGGSPTSEAVFTVAADGVTILEYMQGSYSTGSSSAISAGASPISSSTQLSISYAYDSSAPFAVSVQCTSSASPVTANDVSATVAANSSGNLITLDFSSGAPHYIDIPSGSGPSHGTASVPTISGTQVSYTPAAGYSGSDSFVYRVQDGNGTTAVATVNITVSAPTLVLSPAAGALPNATVGKDYSQTITASGGTAPYSYQLGAWLDASIFPDGLTFSPSTGAIGGTPTKAGTYSFELRATDANGLTVTERYDITVVAPLPPVAIPVSATVAGNSSNNPITLNIVGGAATSVAIGTQAGHGTATASGTSITYTPAAGYSGADSFTYTATNAGGTSAPVTVTISVNPPTSLTLTPSGGALPSAAAGKNYHQIIPLTVSGGTGDTPSRSTLPTAGRFRAGSAFIRRASC
ncbi:Ig-like domain-containing protein [Sinorhizobium sp. BG8]|uniref:Ig-like domain-containing protein n=1 Tax=Sinorhizobium sp. BG8 TaxID=2613773 RepID=UPI00193D9707|nr:Ig-like domain-containing protein [Sinorhizobium sp. BG8]